jgi:hypothetical protein
MAQVIRELAWQVQVLSSNPEPQKQTYDNQMQKKFTVMSKIKHRHFKE